jgi:hypothetical protein
LRSAIGAYAEAAGAFHAEAKLADREPSAWPNHQDALTLSEPAPGAAQLGVH